MKLLIIIFFAALQLANQANANPNHSPRLMLKPTLIRDVETGKVDVALNVDATLREYAGKNFAILGHKGYESIAYQVKSAARYKVVGEKLAEVAKLNGIVFVVTTAKSVAFSFPQENIVYFSGRYLDELPSDVMSYIIAHELGHLTIKKQGREDSEDLAHSIGRSILKEANWYHPCLQAKTDLKLYRLKVEGFHSVNLESDASKVYQECMAKEAGKKQNGVVF